MKWWSQRMLSRRFARPGALLRMHWIVAANDREVVRSQVSPKLGITLVTMAFLFWGRVFHGVPMSYAVPDCFIVITCRVCALTTMASRNCVTLSHQVRICPGPQMLQDMIFFKWKLSSIVYSFHVVFNSHVVSPLRCGVNRWAIAQERDERLAGASLGRAGVIEIRGKNKTPAMAMMMRKTQL